MKFALISISFFCAANVMAQEDDKRVIELGMELTSELQTTNKGNFNNANLLRLNASLPVSRNLSIEAASISTYMTASESIGDDLQTFSNLDAGNIPFALSVCGVSWTYVLPPRGSRREASHSLFIGIRNMNEDYFCSDVTSFFTNSSCGIYPALYEVGKCQLGVFTDYANFVERNEFATELTCKIPIFQYIDIQPTVHLITTDDCLQCAATVRMALHI